MIPEPLVSWERSELFVSGERLEGLVLDAVRRKQAPIEDLEIRFHAGELLVQGKVRAALNVPFRLAIRRIEAEGTVVRIHIEDLHAFGVLPVPKFVMDLAKERLEQQEGVSLSSPDLTLSIDVARFLPAHVDLTLAGVAVVSGGFAVLLGPGGADIPAHR